MVWYDGANEKGINLAVLITIETEFLFFFDFKCLNFPQLPDKEFKNE